MDKDEKIKYKGEDLKLKIEIPTKVYSMAKNDVYSLVQNLINRNIILDACVKDIMEIFMDIIESKKYEVVRGKL